MVRTCYNLFPIYRLVQELFRAFQTPQRVKLDVMANEGNLIRNIAENVAITEI